MPTVKELRKELVAHNRRCRVSGIHKLKKSRLLEISKQKKIPIKITGKSKNRGKYKIGKTIL